MCESKGGRDEKWFMHALFTLNAVDECWKYIVRELMKATRAMKDVPPVELRGLNASWLVLG